MEEDDEIDQLDPSSDGKFESAEENSNESELDDYQPEDNKETNSVGGRVGPGRPRIIRTGKPGRPKKIYNVLNLMSAEI